MRKLELKKGAVIRQLSPAQNRRENEGYRIVE